MSTNAQTYFNELADYVTTQLASDEQFTCWLVVKALILSV